MDKNSRTISINGREIIFETGKIARQADGSVMVRCGDTMVLGTACAANQPAADIDFFPLRVDYQEKFSSAGKTLGGFLKREGRPREKEILTSRLIDRPIRPMFEEGYHNEVQLLTYVLSYDGEHNPDVLAINAASAALVISDIPLLKPVGAVRVGMIDDEFIINPTVEEMKTSRLDLVIAGVEDGILMIEGSCDFLSEEKLLEAVEEGHKAIQEICRGLAGWQNMIGKDKKSAQIMTISDELIKHVEQIAADDFDKSFRIGDKGERGIKQDEIKQNVVDQLLEVPEPLYSKNEVKRALKKVSGNVMRKMILKENKRSDGRTCTDIRPISIDLGILPRTHGSALFTRGETQSIAVCTLGGDSMGQRYETLDEDSTHRFYLQYSFPPFSVGEVGRAGPPGRREIGHGKLAENALRRAVPVAEDFPYTIRLESNITESNGSSSMASVCGGTLAMMEAGIPIKHPIAGIAMGLILENENYAVLSDILGAEDALGDMDFKVTGDQRGITAFQLDIKVPGLTHQIMQVALAQAKEGRLHILNKMLEACPKAKESLSTYAPRIETMQIKPSKIGTVIGPGGKMIRSIVEETGAELNIDDSGLVSISSTNAESLEKAKMMVFNLTAEVEEGKTYKGEIVSIVEFGMFVRIFAQEGLCHISQIEHRQIRDAKEIAEMFKIGDKIEVKVLEINQRGQIRLSRKALLPTQPKQPA